MWIVAEVVDQKDAVPFQFITVDPTTVRILHVNSNKYVCVATAEGHNDCLSVRDSRNDDSKSYLFQIINT